MNDDDGWDWRWLYFAGLHIFKLTEKAFWRLTPRQLHVLSSEYEKYNQKKNGESVGTSQNSDKSVYIDQLW